MRRAPAWGSSSRGSPRQAATAWTATSAQASPAAGPRMPKGGRSQHTSPHLAGRPLDKVGAGGCTAVGPWPLLPMAQDFVQRTSPEKKRLAAALAAMIEAWTEVAVGGAGEPLEPTQRDQATSPEHERPRPRRPT